MAIIVIAVSVWGYQFLRGKNILKSGNTYYVRYENIETLAKSSAVFIRGMQVGTVTGIELEDDMQTIVATLSLDGNIRIPNDAVAVISSSGLLGGKVIEIMINKACSGPDCAPSGSFISGKAKGLFDTFLDPGEGGTLSQVKGTISEILQNLGDSLTSPSANNEIAKTYIQLSKLITNLASITGTLEQSMSKYDRQVQSTLVNIETLTRAFADNQDKIASSISHLESITAQLDQADAGSLVTEAREAIGTLESTMSDAQKSFDQLSLMMQDLQSGNGTMGKLLKDEGLYDNMVKTSKNLDLLLQDFRLNPKRYVNVSVFGKKQRAYSLPEDDPAFKQ